MDGGVGRVTMDLAQFHQRLSTHFADLARSRADDHSVFALEHGLSSDELETLQAQIRASIASERPKREHALAWIAYAAEIGYRYAGDEYWQTFEQETPWWTVNGDRGWIRDAFVRFHVQYRGAVPSGAWATQFSIIAWPITHAILPRDLQQQLARVLYDVRHSFSAGLLESPELLGQFIAARSWNASARFQNLAQQPALLGQIAAALLLQGQTEKGGLLHPLTLRRIGDDVDRERRGRTWLLAARNHAEQRAQVRGLTIAKPTRTGVRERDEARAEVAALGIEPRLVLRPLAAARWEVSLEMPDLSHLLVRFPQVRDALVESRCTVAGAAGRPLARGRLLHGPQRIALSRWPRSDELLLKFERTDAQLEYLLRTECLLRPGTSWLFRIASDGLAYESRGMRARAGQRYLHLSTEGPVRADLARPVEVACEGVFGSTFELPAVLTPDWELLLRKLEVRQAKSIEIWPAGLAAVVWDGDGQGEWLASESPTLAIRADHAVDHLLVSMGVGEAALEVDMSMTAPGVPIFIELPTLPVGTYQLSVVARKGPGEIVGDANVVIRVRDARPWSPGVTPHGPLNVESEPAAPTLEQLWEGRALVRVLGPEGRALHCRVAMFGRLDAETPIFEHRLEETALPLEVEQWQHQLDAVRGLPAAQNAYDDARVCEVEFSADELGAFTLRCEREFAPLRWSLRRGTSGFVSHLHQDVDEGATPQLQRFPFEQPASPETLPARADSNYPAPRAGGLYVATLAGFKASIIVPPVVRDFHELKLEPRIDVGLSRDAILRCTQIANLWACARLPGDMISAQRCRFVQRAIARKLAALFGGVDWEDAEASIGDGPDGLLSLKRGVSSKPQERGVGAKIDLDRDALAKASLVARVDAISSLAERFKLVESPPASSTASADTKWLGEFALRLASAPSSLHAWAGSNLSAGIDRLLTAPTLARAARFLVVAVDRQLLNQPGARGVYAGWEWQV